MTVRVEPWRLPNGDHSFCAVLNVVRDDIHIDLRYNSVQIYKEKDVAMEETFAELLTARKSDEYLLLDEADYKSEDIFLLKASEALTAILSK
jgi:hypothetical protein